MFMSKLYSYSPMSEHFDKRDCSVRALMIAGALTYPLAYRACELAGRPKNRGLKFMDMAEAIRHAGFPVDPFTYETWYAYPSGSLHQFVLRNAVGNYVVAVRDHYLAVCNGVIHDHESNRTRMRRRVIFSWKIERD